MKLFGRSACLPPGGGPVVVAFLEGWAAAGDPHVPALAARTPAYARLARRANTFGLRPGPAPSFAAAMAAIAEAKPPRAPDVALDRLMRRDGGLMAEPGFANFVRELSAVGGDCHLVTVLTPSGIEGRTGHAAKVAATLAYEGIRVWLHAILDGRDTAPDGALAALRAFEDDVAGSPDIRLATIAGRAHVLDETATPESLAAACRAMADATPAAPASLPDHIDTANRRGKNDALIAPVAAPGYPGMRSDDAVLLLHPRPDGLQGLLDALVPGGGLAVPGPRPIALTACRRLIGWPHAGDQARAPVHLFQPARPRLPARIAEIDAHLSMIAPAAQVPLIAASFEGCTAAASRLAPVSGPLEVSDAAVREIKRGHAGTIMAFLCGMPGAARGAHAGTAARRIVEIQDKALGRIAAIMERRGGTLVALGTDTALCDPARLDPDAAVLPCLVLGPKPPASPPAGLEDVAALLLDMSAHAGPEKKAAKAAEAGRP